MENNPESACIESLLKEAIRFSLSGLKPIEKVVLQLRYALENGGEYTFSKIAKELGIKIGHAQAIHKRAIRKLRHPYYSRVLKGYIVQDEITREEMAIRNLVWANCYQHLVRKGERKICGICKKRKKV